MAYRSNPQDSTLLNYLKNIYIFRILKLKQTWFGFFFPPKTKVSPWYTTEQPKYASVSTPSVKWVRIGFSEAFFTRLFIFCAYIVGVISYDCQKYTKWDPFNRRIRIKTWLYRWGKVNTSLETMTSYGENL